MRFAAFMAHLAVALRDPLPEYTELLRALREGTDTLGGTERKLSRMAAEEGYPFDWGGGTFSDLLRGKPGPGGGFEATPAAFGFFLIGYLLDCPRREAAVKALDMTFAACRRSQTMDEQPWTPSVPAPLPSEKGEAICTKTKQRYFGAALVAMLSDRTLFDQTVTISICADLGVAQLVFKDGTESSFYTPDYYKRKPGRYSVRHLWLDAIRSLFDLINQSEPAEQAPAKRRLLPR